ncbi:hypothetical protein AtubIFM61612_009948 [Aspergillus tubingensis]|nr:hypothetical protein AtubIFM61612_009948 [Aspergillus tubingensis]
MTPTMPVWCVSPAIGSQLRSGDDASDKSARSQRLTPHDSFQSSISSVSRGKVVGMVAWGDTGNGIHHRRGNWGRSPRTETAAFKVEPASGPQTPAQQHAKATGQSPCGAVCIIASGGAKSPRSGTPWRFRWGHSAAAPIISLELGSRCSYWLTWRNAVVVCVIIPKEARLADFAPKVGAKASLPGVL